MKISIVLLVNLVAMVLAVAPAVTVVLVCQIQFPCEVVLANRTQRPNVLWRWLLFQLQYYCSLWEIS